MDSVHLSSSPACARALIPVPRTDDDNESAYSLRASLHCATVICPFVFYTIAARSLFVRILAVTFPCSARIPRYLRSNLRGTNNVDGLTTFSDFGRPGVSVLHQMPRWSIGLSKIHNSRTLFLTINKSPYHGVTRGRTGRI